WRALATESRQQAAVGGVDRGADELVDDQPAPAAAPAAVAAPPPALVGARFDADYLHNPKPVYPAASRRLGEEGRVLLRVRVSAQGLPLSVDIRQSSGSPRLDEAARAAVERWRFVPAKQGTEAVESTVVVPLQFTLDS
ncbi:MAG: energy transducer TonB, partial [Accumulibacter sp.]|uniref:energy transducer TonB n=1 Tax=Accumulibacter sp. TaxID=2053492 RepID=UPI003314F099